MMRAAKANYTYASFDAHLQKVAAMKPTMLLMITIFLIFPAISQAESPFSSLQSAKEKTTVLQDLRKICTPQASLSDEAWEKLMLSDENNKQHIREAIVAMERNNQSNYWEALGKVECPDM
ncbi:putative transport protein [Escherichia coli M605]|jgi:hypothetical protein|nr:putative transport protein [Escherichia coli M605]PLK02215.1 hypothetical protein B7L58_10950 [Escherichia coli]